MATKNTENTKRMGADFENHSLTFICALCVICG